MTAEFIKEAENVVKVNTRALTDDDNFKVEIVANSGSNMYVFDVFGSKENMGKLIGRGGQNANAVRTILGACAKKHGCSAVIQFYDAQD